MSLPGPIGIGFKLPELIVESIIRDGFQNIKNDMSIVDYLFNEFLRTYNVQKYGQPEIDKIKALIMKPIAVVYDYGEVGAKSPCYSIMLGTDEEDKQRAVLGDLYEQLDEPITDPIELEGLIVVNNMTPTSYDPNTGFVHVADSVDLTPVYAGFIYTDASNVDHEVLVGMSNIDGSKYFLIGKNEEVDISGPGVIKSPLDYEVFELKGLTSNIMLHIGVHAKDALTCKYLYILLKYFIFSRKFDLITRGIYVSSFSGSDFIRDGNYGGDKVFNRMLVVSGKVDDTWRADQVVLIDAIIINAVPVDTDPNDPDDLLPAGDDTDNDDGDPVN